MITFLRRHDFIYSPMVQLVPIFLRIFIIVKEENIDCTYATFEGIIAEQNFADVCDQGYVAYHFYSIEECLF